MKLKLTLLALLFFASIGNCWAQTESKHFGLDFYPLPMLLGEIGLEANVPIGKTAIGVNAIYYNPDFLLSGLLLRADLGDGDELDMNVHSFIPGLSFSYYSKGGAEGFYIGGSFLYKMSSGDVLLKDKYTGGSAYRGIVEADLDIKSVDFGVRSGYRFVFNRGFSLRLGGRFGYQNNMTNDVVYTIVEDTEDEADEVIADLEEGIERYSKKFTKPITFLVEIGIGFTF